MNRSTFYSALIFALLLVTGAVCTTAQTNPTPFNLAGGDYSFTDWPNTSPAGTYPSSMALHMFEQRLEPFAGSITDAPVADWVLAYNLTGGARITGQGTNGIRFEQTATGQTGYCNFPGAAVLALNATGRANIRVSFVAQTLSIQPRPYVLRLQYRTGTSGAWTDAIGANGDRVEHRSLTSGTGRVTYTWNAPLSLENVATVQLRWLYFQDGDGSGNRPAIFLDDVIVRSDSPVGTATQLSVMSITPASPSINNAFTVMVRSTDALGAVKNVSTATTVTLTRTGGTGALSGTLTGTIPAGSSAITFSNVSYNTAEPGVSITASRTAGDVLNPGTSATFTVGGLPAYALTSMTQTIAWAGSAMNPFTVTVYRADNTVDVNYGSPITVALISGSGTLTGTTTATPFRGVATFDNVIPTTAGNVTLRITVPGVPSITLPTILVDASPSLTANIVPQFIYGGLRSTTSCSVTSFITPAYARVTFTGLKPNTSYRYVTGAGNVAAAVPTTVGGGFNIHWNDNTKSFTGSSGKSITTPGEHSVFSTGPSETTKSLWINLLPTNAETYLTGRTIYWQVALADQFGNLIRNYQLPTTSIAQTNTTDNTGSTLIGDISSQLKPLDYVLLYDNTAGSGRPLAISIVQSYNTSIGFATNRYRFDVENISGSWMTQIPNTLATGVRRIEQRSAATSAIVAATTSADGVWNNVGTYPLDPSRYPSGPGSSVTPIYLETPSITISSPMAGDTLCAGVPTRINFRADGMNFVRIEYSYDGGATYSEAAASVPASDGAFEWVVQGAGFQGNCRIRITGVDRPNENAVSGRFTVVEPLAIVGELQSKNLCLGDDDTLIALVSGNVESYTWYKNGQVIPNANSPILHITDAHYQTSGIFWCVVDGYGACGTVTTNQAHIRVARQTQIVNQTRAVAGEIGKTATLQVNVEFPDEVLSYQWYKGQTVLTDNGHYFGSTSNRLEIRNFAQNDYSNEYYCVVTGVCGIATSRVVRVFPAGVYAEFVDPTIDACTGGTVTLAADVYSNPAGEQLIIRWYRNGTLLTDDARYSGTTTATLTIANVTPADAGDYEVRVHLAVDAGMSSSATATVGIATTPTITVPPVGGDYCEGEAVTLNVSAAATGTINYQWFFNNVPIPGANTNSFAIASMTQQRSGNYKVVVSTACGSVESREAAVAYKTPTSISQQPPPTVDVQAGQTLTISVVANGAGTLQYQWFKDGAALTGEVASTFTKAATVSGDAGKYWVTVTSECGLVTSDTTTVNIQPVSSVNEDVVAGVATVTRVAPHPASNQSAFTVSLNADAFVTVQIVDAAGSVVATVAGQQLSAGDHRFVVDAQPLATGMYSIHTVIGQAMHVQPLVVIK